MMKWVMINRSGKYYSIETSESDDVWRYQKVSTSLLIGNLLINKFTFLRNPWIRDRRVKGWYEGDRSERVVPYEFME